MSKDVMIKGMCLVICNLNGEGKMGTVAVAKMFRKWSDVKLEYTLRGLDHKTTKPFPVSTEVGKDMIRRYDALL